MAEHLLSRRGRLWAWTTQEFPPPSPPYAGPTGDAFVPYGVGYVELGGEVRVETRLTETEGLWIGMDMELVLVPFRTDDEGNEVVDPVLVSVAVPLLHARCNLRRRRPRPRAVAPRRCASSPIEVSR
jgi:uncharacterized OB-fold protein